MSHCLIVGGTRGLGRVVASMMVARGDTVSILGRREPVDSDKDIEGIRHWITDILDHEQLDATLNKIIEQEGSLNYLVFCHRYRGDGDPWQGELDATLSATRDIVEKLSNHFEKNSDCSMVMVSSVFADYIGEGQPISYHVGKAGLNHMARFYAVELGRNGIRSNALTTFTFLKEESEKFYLENKPLMDLYEKIIPIGRLGKTQDSANVICFLCSPESNYINGQNIYVDGGLSVMWPETIARSLTGI